MNYISTTELRTKASKLKDSLQRGESTYILHRSKIIGVIEPYSTSVITATREKLEAFIKAFPVEKPLSYEERKRIYTKHLKEKYGKRIS